MDNEKLKSFLAGSDNSESFEKEGLRTMAEQMIKAMNRIDTYACGLDEPREIRDEESPEEYALRMKADKLQKQAREERNNMYLDSFIKAFCDFLEMKYGLK